MIAMTMECKARWLMEVLNVVLKLAAVFTRERNVLGRGCECNHGAKHIGRQKIEDGLEKVHLYLGRIMIMEKLHY